MSPEAVRSPSREPMRETVTGGRLRVEIDRDPCPPEARPCGSDCPFTERESLGVRELRPHAAPFRQLAELTYCEGLRSGALEHESGGRLARMAIELEAGGSGKAGAGDPARARRAVSGLEISIADRTVSVPVATIATPCILEARRADAARTGRMPALPLYEARITWEPEGNSGSARHRQARPPAVKVGRRVVEGALPVGLREVALDRPATGAAAGSEERSPMVEVVWLDPDGLGRAREAAAKEPGREIAFLLVGAMKFSRERRIAFTEVHQVAPVRRYDVSNEVLAAISPESYAEVKAAAARDGLDVVGILHSHVLEMIERDGGDQGRSRGQGREAREETARNDGPSREETPEREKASGLFFSGIDVQDHAFFLPSPWSIGGVLNVKRRGRVELGVFARHVDGSFVPAKTMYVRE